MRNNQPMSKLTLTTLSITRRSSSVLLGLVALLALPGCRATTDNQIDLLERELRVQENYIYELESYVVEYSEKLRDTRCEFPQQMAGYSEEMSEPESTSTENVAPRRSVQEESILNFEQDDLPPPARRKSRSQPKPPETSTEDASPEDISPEDISPEDIDVPDEIDFEMGDPVSELENAQPLRQASVVSAAGRLLIPDPVAYVDAPEVDDSNVNEPGAFEEMATNEQIDDEPIVEDLFADEQVEETAAFSDRVAERLEVTQLFEGGGEGQSLQSLLAVVEALDARGEPVDLNGEVSLMVMTTDATAPTRIKRWNFTTEETAEAWQSTDLGDGLHLELPMEKSQLPKESLELWVRLVTADGRKLLTQLPFDPNQLSDLASIDADEPTESIAKVEATAAPLNSLRIENANTSVGTSTGTSVGGTSSGEILKTVEVEAPADQPKWRSSMERTDRTAGGFATSKSKSLGWKTQSPGRMATAPARVATRNVPLQPSTIKPQTPDSQSTWSSGSSVQRTSNQNSTVSSASNGWSSSR